MSFVIPAWLKPLKNYFNPDFTTFNSLASIGIPLPRLIT